MSSIVLAALQKADPRLQAIDDGSGCLTYGELHRSVLEQSAWLSSHGARRCATLADNSARWVITDLALIGCGAVHVPVPAYFSAAQIAHLLADADIDCVLTDDPQRAQTIDSRFLVAKTAPGTGFTLLQRAGKRVTRVERPLKITYTSGSTGTPKGICLQQGALDQVASALAAVTAGLKIESHMCVLPLPTLLENIAGVYAPVLLGARIHIRSNEAIGMSYGRMNPSALLSAIGDAQPHSLVLVPELLRILLQAIAHGWAPPSSLKFIAVGGASVSVELLRRAHDHGLPVYEGYGLSECASVVCLNTPDYNRPGSVGRPLPHARVRIDLNGEICVTGATMSGYIGEPESNPAEVRTGDLGQIDADGFVYVMGRSKNMFVTSMGRNVTPEWVERELTCEPAITSAMVSGEAQPYPVALVAPSQNATAAMLGDAIARANERLPNYARVRRWCCFPEPPTAMNGLMTSNGRLRRSEILARYRALIDSLYDEEDDFAHDIS